MIGTAVLVTAGLLLLALSGPARGDGGEQSPALAETAEMAREGTGKTPPPPRRENASVRRPWSQGEKLATVVPPGSTSPKANVLRYTIALPKDILVKGDVYCALFDESGWPWNPTKSDTRKASGASVTCEFHQLGGGRYAVAAFFDHNGNGELDRNWLGMPEEPWLLSQGVRPHLPIPPAFDEVSFDFNGGTLVMQAELKG
ncbi:DUF2141 domain-containing protein [Myxococcota bacterium]